MNISALWFQPISTGFPTRGSIGILVSFLLFGCANPPTGPMSATLPPTAVCCMPYSDMKYTELKIDSEQAADLREGTPAHEFLEGKSFYRAFVLPARTGPSKLKYKAFVGGIALPYATVVRPYFVFLDKDKAEVSLVPDPPAFSGTELLRGSFFKGEVPIPEEAAYVVLYTSERPVAPRTVFSANGTAWPAKPSMSGNLSLTATKQ